VHTQSGPDPGAGGVRAQRVRRPARLLARQGGPEGSEGLEGKATFYIFFYFLFFILEK